MPTSPSRYTWGLTSSLIPTSRYCTEPVTTGVPVDTGVTVLVITGTFSPIRILAFWLSRVRNFGAASTLPSESDKLKLAVAPNGPPTTPSLFSGMCPRSCSVFTPLGVWTPKVLGHWMPSSRIRSRDTSSTSTSSITSGSG